MVIDSFLYNITIQPQVFSLYAVHTEASAKTSALPCCELQDYV